ncbi:aminoacyl-tRNA hydrolase [Sphingobium sufflavum]|uniref:alternative ribosome rescue aminoacyl-tRNA hydrolase ArfB n=1 Tax=Sphingobium sufflavum TaxID=1129547 RepID=UPI001F26E05B|nr:alternative ribosome rescue aminoacyl-tRNA hydrolase ArfB [Sphingobium sufflavum]MCE7798541.1 aminoacyl-tRNA hydrolase [Sphingobium sufflavum]
MPVIPITRSIAINEDEIDYSTTRSGGAGGQHVNTTDSAVILRFDVGLSPSLPLAVKNRLAVLAGSRLTADGVLILRAEGSRSQHDNKREALDRLVDLIAQATLVPKRRKPTKPTKGSQVRRVDAKKQRSGVKQGRGRVRMD